MIQLGCLGSFIKIYDIEKEQLDELYEFFLFKDTKNGRRVRMGKFTKFIPNKWSPINRKTKVTGIGMLEYVSAFLTDKGWPFVLRDFREFPKTNVDLDAVQWNRILMDPNKPGQWLRFHSYQIEILKRCIREKCGNVESPTGSGKTPTFGGLVKLLNLPTLIIFNEVALAHQTYDEFKKFGFREDDLGMVQGANVKHAKYMMCTIRSMEKVFDFIELYPVVIFDECHVTQSNEYEYVFTHLHSPYRFGFSGTVYDKTNPAHFGRVVKYVGPIIYDKATGGKDTIDLINEGYLAKSEFVFVNCNRDRGLSISWTQSGKNYPELYRREIVDNEYRNGLIALICAKHIKDKIVILYESVLHDHGEKIAAIIREYMPDRHLKILDGSDPVGHRKQAVAFFEKNEGGIIIASRIFNTGINIRSVKIGINAAGGKAYIRAVQKAGRMMRRTDEKDSMVFYDFVDENAKVMLRQSNARKKIYKDQGHKVRTIEPKQI